MRQAPNQNKRTETKFIATRKEDGEHSISIIVFTIKLDKLHQIK